MASSRLPIWGCLSECRATHCTRDVIDSGLLLSGGAKVALRFPCAEPRVVPHLTTSLAAPAAIRPPAVRCHVPLKGFFVRHTFTYYGASSRKQYLITMLRKAESSLPLSSAAHFTSTRRSFVLVSRIPPPSSVGFIRTASERTRFGRSDFLDAGLVFFLRESFLTGTSDHSSGSCP